MLDVRSIEKVYISCRKSDMRKSINGLAVIVQESFQLDPFENAIFLFYNGDKTRAKLLKWDHNGFVLYYKRLEKGRFPIPSYASNGAAVISGNELRGLLDGISLDQYAKSNGKCRRPREVKERKLV
jgi:transposase